jgi:hypothetical protein
MEVPVAGRATLLLLAHRRERDVHHPEGESRVVRRRALRLPRADELLGPADPDACAKCFAAVPADSEGVRIMAIAGNLPEQQTASST